MKVSIVKKESEKEVYFRNLDYVSLVDNFSYLDNGTWILWVGWSQRKDRKIEIVSVN